MDGDSIWSAGMRAAPRRQTDTIGFGVDRRQLCRAKAACHVYIVVVASKPKIVAEEKVLKEAMCFDAAWKLSPQDAPSFRSLLPRFQFLKSHALIGQEERSGEVGPECFATKIGLMKRVPRCAHLVTGEGLSWRFPFRDYRAIEFLDGNSFGSEHEVLIWRAKMRKGYFRAMQPNAKAARDGIIRRHTFKWKKAATTDDSSLNLFETVPAHQAAVRFDYFSYQLIHVALQCISHITSKCKSTKTVLAASCGRQEIKGIDEHYGFLVDRRIEELCGRLAAFAFSLW